MSKPKNIKNISNYWYKEDDIADLLNRLAPEGVDVFAQTQFEHEDLLTDNFQKAIENVVQTGRTQLMPIHLHGNHWAGAIVRMQANGQIQVIYNDPLGDALESQPNAMKLVAAVQSVVEGTNIIDLRLRQQRNGNDCGPFTTDNLIQLASDNGLDGLDRQAILGRGILATPVNGSALEIRNRYAAILPRLEDGDVENKTPEKLKERKSHKSDDAFKGDVEKLLNLKSKISDLKTASEKDSQIKILSEIGEIASSVYRKEIDKSAIRNRFSSNEQSKKNILYLDALELLTHLPSDQHRINSNLFEDAVPKIISDLEIISQNVDAVLCEKENYERAKKIFPKDEMLNKIESIQSLAPQENANNPQNLKAFITAFYMPKALERMREVVPLNRSLQSDELYIGLSDIVPITPEYNWDDRIDRYSFARTFAILGELSRDISCVITDRNEQREFFQNLKKIRNNLKGLAHKKFFSDGNKVAFKQKNGDEVLFVEDLENFNKVSAYFEEFDKSLEVMQGFFSKETLPNLDSVKEAYSKKIPSGYSVLEEFEKILEGKNPFKGGLDKLLSDTIDKYCAVQNLREEVKQAGGVDQILKGYNETFALVDSQIKSDLKLPYAEDEIIKFDQKDVKLNKDQALKLKEYLGKLKQAKKALSLKVAEQELDNLKKKYREDFEKIEDEYLEKVPNPEDSVESERYLEDERLKRKAQRDDKEEKRRNKSPRERFLKYCTDFKKEATRLKSITSFIPENEEQKQRHEFAVAHSVGIIGEAIRYLFEIDDETNFLGEFARRGLVEDINETRMVRNKQVMHGTFNYDADAVSRAATQNTTPWVPDIQAIGLISAFWEEPKNFELLYKQYLGTKEEAEEMTLEEMKCDTSIFLGASYLRLGKMEEARKEFTKAKAIAESDEIEPNSQNIVRINTCLAAIARTQKDYGLALQLTNEAIKESYKRIVFLERYYVATDETKRDEEIIRAKLERADLLSNKATLISEVGNNEEAKELYKEAMAQGLVPAAIALGQMLYEEKKYDEAIGIYREQFLKIKPEREKRPFEFIQILRGIWLAQSESGQHEAERTFNDYVNFYRKNIPLFKEHCGQGYENVEALILQDEATNLYQNGHYTRAINRLENALSLLDETGVRTTGDISHIHLTIANCYKYLASKFSKDDSNVSEFRRIAVQNYEQAIKSSDQPQSIDIAHAHAGLAEIFARQGLTRKSENHKNKANNIFNRHKKIGTGYAEIMRSSLRVINPRQNTEVQNEDESFSDEQAFFQSLLPGINDSIKNSNYRDALNSINFFLSYMKSLNSNNPVVAQLKFQKFACHSHLKERGNAIDSYKSFEEFAKSHPDCADDSYSRTANKIFHDNFSTSLQEELENQTPNTAISSTSTSSLLERSYTR